MIKATLHISTLCACINLGSLYCAEPQRGELKAIAGPIVAPEGERRTPTLPTQVVVGAQELMAIDAELSNLNEHERAQLIAEMGEERDPDQKKLINYIKEMLY